MALSTVVTTLIILVISVLLASVVTYFAINVTSTRVQEESLQLTKQHIWHLDSTSEAAIMLINTGGRDLAIDKLAVRGQEVAWSKVIYTITTDSVSSDLACQASVSAGQIRIGSTNYTFTQASNDLTLQSGKTMIIYIRNPDSITINDIGLTVSITLYTAQAMYYRESNVQAYSATTSTSTPQATTEPTNEPQAPGAADIDVRSGAFYGDYASQGEVVIKNNENSAITVTGITLKNIAGTDFYAAVGQNIAVEFLQGIYPDDLPTIDFNGHTLQQATSVTIPSGSTAVIYFAANLTAQDEQVTLSLTITGFQVHTEQVNVSQMPDATEHTGPANQ